MMSEEHTRRQVETLLLEAGWNSDDILEEQSVYFRGRVLRPDMVLLCQLFPLAVIEIKGSAAGLESAAYQVLQYAEAVEVPFAFVTDGIRIVEVSTAGSQSREYQRFPAPPDLWSMLGREWDESDPRLFPPLRSPQMAPRLHHAHAVSRAIDAVMNGRKRVLMTMATGTGKTYVALQIAWKLLQSGYCQRMLYLHSRLADIASARRAFEPLGESVQLRSRRMDIPAHRLQFATPMFFYGSKDTPALSRFPSNFYDLIISDVDPISMVEPLVKYFCEAIAIGITAREVPGSRITRLFGQPSFIYSVQEALRTEEMQVPEGFTEVRLGDIADIQMGLAGVRARDNVLEPNEDDVHWITARDISPYRSLHPGVLPTVNVESAHLDERFLLKPGDMLIASSATGARIRTGFVPQNLPHPTAFSSSLIRIRVNPRLADPEYVFSFLNSDIGQLAIRRFATRLSTAVSQISLQELRQIPVFLPKDQVGKEVAEQLSVASLAKQQIEREILPHLDEIQRASGHQAGRANQECELVASRLKDLAVMLAPPGLPERVMAEYPTPIALAYRRFHDARFNVYEQVLRLRDVFEATAYYFYNLVLSDAFRRLDPVEYYVDDRGVRRAYNGYSMGLRMDFVARILQIAEAKNGQDLFVPELVHSATLVDLAKQLQDDFRNRLSHTATATESQQRRCLKEFKPIVEEMLSELEWLVNYRLVRIPAFYFQHGSLVRRMEVYQGVVPELNEQPLPESTEVTRADRNHLVLLNTEDQVLDLYPLYQLLASEETRHETHLCFFKQRRAQAQLLEGESVQGAFAVRLEGFEDFESLQSRILDILPGE